MHLTPAVCFTAWPARGDKPDAKSVPISKPGDGAQTTGLNQKPDNTNYSTNTASYFELLQLNIGLVKNFSPAFEEFSTSTRTLNCVVRNARNDARSAAIQGSVLEDQQRENALRVGQEQG